MFQNLKNNLAPNYSRWTKLHPALRSFALCLFLGLFLFLFSQNSQSTQVEQTQPDSLDTVIPSGYVLVPIEVQNPEALVSLLGRYGVVDLFAPSVDGTSKPTRVARRVKIVRAPLNPQQYAVLAPEEEAPLIVKQAIPLMVVVQNPNQSGTDIVKAKRKTSRIFLE